ncbi:hypothetical protein ACINK0_03820 [Deinococcus sp. VB343]|uniref:hypothetical protein n=1 Tax=Deinococcus sp. VB343 TaxID=3385567 RepID=UPI0039C9DA88
MKKNIALMALTGILTLASCGQNGAPDDKAEAPKSVVLSASPLTVASTGGAVTLSGSATDNVAVTKVVVKGGTTTLTCTVNGTTSVTYTCPTDNLPANTSTADKPYTYQATAYDAAGNETLSNSVTVTVKGATTPPPPTTRTLTIDLVNVSNAPITVRDAAGTIVQGYNNVTVADNATISDLPAGVYTVTGANANGWNAPMSSVRVDLTSANGTAVLTYTKSDVIPTGSITITSPATGASFKVGDEVRVTFNTSNLDATKAVTCSLGANNTATAVVSGTQGYCDLTVKNTTDLNIVVSGKDTAGNTVSDARSVAVAAAPIPPLSPVLTVGNTLITPTAFDNCTTQPGLNGYMPITNASGPGTPTYPVGVDGRAYFVKGQVRINLTGGNIAEGAKVEAYYETTQPNSAVQKLPVMKDADGYYVMFDSSYGAQAGSTDRSHEGVPTAIWFRVDNNDLARIVVVPDNMAPEAINPQIDAKRRINAGGQIWVAGDIDIYSANKAIEDKPLGSDGKINAGFERVCYYMVPESASIVDYNGDNPKGLNDFTKSIRTAGGAVAVTGTGLFTPGSDKFFKKTFETAVIDPNTTNGYIATKKNIADGRYKVYAITTDKLGNERPSSTPFRVTVDNTAPNVSNIVVKIVDDSPLPFPAEDGYVSDYAKVFLRNADDPAKPATLAGTDGTGIGVDNRTASCVFNGINLFETGSFNGNVFTPSTDGTGVFRYDNARLDSNKWADQAYDVSCGRNVKDLLGNVNPNANVTSFKVTVDNIDPTIDITNPDMAGVLTSGRTYRPEAQARDQISGVRESYLFWSPVTTVDFLNKLRPGAATAYPFLADNAYNSGPLVNPIEIMRSGRDQQTLGGIEWKAPSYDDQNLPADILAAARIGIFGLTVDKAGNATLRSKSYAYESDRRPAFSNLNNVFQNSVYTASSYPLADNQKNKLPAGATGKNTIYGATTTAITDRVNLLNIEGQDPRTTVARGEVTLEVDARTVQNSYGTLEVPKVYGRFNSIDWQAIRNYMLTPAADQRDMPFPGPSGVPGSYAGLPIGDLLDATLPGYYTNNITTSNTGDPSYNTGANHRVTSDLRSDWNLFLAPWMTLQGVTNTPDVDNRYTLTNSLNNPLVMRNTSGQTAKTVNGWVRGTFTNTPASRFPTNACVFNGSAVDNFDHTNVLTGQDKATQLPWDTYCTPFKTQYDQINMIFTAGDGDFVFTGRNLGGNR